MAGRNVADGRPAEGQLQCKDSRDGLDLLRQTPPEEWRLKAARMRSGFFRASTDLRAISKYMNVTLPQLDVLMKEANISYRDDVPIAEGDYNKLVDLMESVDKLLSRNEEITAGEVRQADGKRKRDDADGEVSGGPVAMKSRAIRDMTPTQLLDSLMKTSMTRWHAIGDELPQYLQRMRYQVTPKDLAYRFNLDITQVNVAMGEGKFFCNSNHIIADRNLRILEGVMRNMRVIIADITKRIPVAEESLNKRQRLEDSSDAETKVASTKRVIDGVVSLTLAEWKRVQIGFAAIVDKRKGTPKDVSSACSLSQVEVDALMNEARFSCPLNNLIGLNNLSRLHDLIKKKVEESQVTAAQALATAQRDDDMKLLSLRPPESWTRVLGRLQSSSPDKASTPALMMKISGVSPPQMEAILRQTALLVDMEEKCSSETLERICSFIEDLTVVAFPVKDMVLEEGELDAVDGGNSSTKDTTEIMTAATVETTAIVNEPEGPRRYRRITAEEFQAAGGDPDALEDVFSEYLDDSLEDVDEDVLEHLFSSGFLVIVTGNVNGAGTVEAETARLDALDSSQEPIGSDGPACDVCGAFGHIPSSCNFAVKTKKGDNYHVNFNNIAKLSRGEVISLRESCRLRGRLSKKLSQNESRIIEGRFEKFISEKSQ